MRKFKLEVDFQKYHLFALHANIERTRKSGLQHRLSSNAEKAKTNAIYRQAMRKRLSEHQCSIENVRTPQTFSRKV